MKNLQQVVFVVLLALLVSLTACSPTVPTVEAIETHFEKNYSDIQVVVEFLINSSYSSIYCSKVDGTMQADLETVDIEDENVSSALKRLLGSSPVEGKQYYSVSKSGNTISLLQWKSVRDVGCGVAYSINEVDLPSIQYGTELVPLSKTSWYYYVDDYNAWRVGKRPEGQGDGGQGQGDGSVVP